MSKQKQKGVIPILTNLFWKDKNGEDVHAGDIVEVYNPEWMKKPVRFKVFFNPLEVCEDSAAGWLLLMFIVSGAQCTESLEQFTTIVERRNNDRARTCFDIGKP